jgi:hypothetical protein
MDHGGAQGLVHELVHWASAVVLVVGGAVVLALMARARRRERRVSLPAPRRVASHPLDRSLAVMLAGLSLGAAVIHLVAAPPHYVELGDLGAGFLAAAVLQAAWARAILKGASARTVAAGFAINAAILAAWLVSRMVGLPIGPMPSAAEQIGLPDAAASTFELLVIAGLTVRLLALDRRVGLQFPAARSVLAVTVVPVLGLVLLTTSLATLAIGAGAEHGVPGVEHEMSGSQHTSAWVTSGGISAWADGR